MSASEDESPGNLGDMLDELCALAGMKRCEDMQGVKVLSKREALAVLTLVRGLQKIVEGINACGSNKPGAV